MSNWLNGDVGPFVDDYRDLYENAPCGYVLLVPSGNVRQVNATFCEWVDSPAEHIVGRSMLELVNFAEDVVHGDPHVELPLIDVYADGCVLDLTTAHGEKLPVVASATELRNADGTSLGLRVTILRADERRQLMRDLMAARDAELGAHRRLEELNAVLEDRIADSMAEQTKIREFSELQEQFIAVLGHDLRNPVAAIDSGATMLLRQGWSERAPVILNLMRNSVVRMNGLIDNVLDLARFRLGGGISLNLEPGRPLAPTLEQVIDEIRTAHPERPIEVDLAVDDSVPVDHLRIAQLYSNLLGNALKHGAADGPIRSKCLEASGTLELSVSNTGEPIPPELLEHLFMPFHRGKIRQNEGGLGLGLFIASQIAEAHGGILDVRSDATETCFTLRMPV